jgi:hypothetical protein
LNSRKPTSASMRRFISMPHTSPSSAQLRPGHPSCNASYPTPAATPAPL